MFSSVLATDEIRFILKKYILQTSHKTNFLTIFDIISIQSFVNKIICFLVSNTRKLFYFLNST
jgi:hypothetical protein